MSPISATMMAPTTRPTPGWRRPEDCSPWSTTASATERSAAWGERPLEQARAQPGRELDPYRGPPASGVAEYLSEPVWLWPEHTMRPEREGMAGNRASV
jgi:hypothetical protein